MMGKNCWNNKTRYCPSQSMVVVVILGGVLITPAERFIDPWKQKAHLPEVNYGN